MIGVVWTFLLSWRWPLHNRDDARHLQDAIGGIRISIWYTARLCHHDFPNQPSTRLRRLASAHLDTLTLEPPVRYDLFRWQGETKLLTNLAALSIFRLQLERTFHVSLTHVSPTGITAHLCSVSEYRGQRTARFCDILEPLCRCEHCFCA